jgi:predicted metalloendopeptidase
MFDSWRKPAEAKVHAEKILALEIAMSKPRFDRVERRDRRESHNLMTIAELQKLTRRLMEYLLYKNRFKT